MTSEILVIGGESHFQGDSDTDSVIFLEMV